MPALPSGLRFISDLLPIWKLVEKVRMELRSGATLLFVPELLMIQKPDDLRRYVRILWIVPEVADMRTPPELARHLTKLPTGWCVVDSGYTFDHLPGHLGTQDRNMLERLWSLPGHRRCQQKLMSVVQWYRNYMARSTSDDFSLIASWFSPDESK